MSAVASQPSAPVAPAPPAPPAPPVVASATQVRPPKPGAGPLAALATKAIPKAQPAGWWHVSGIRGMKADVAKSVATNADIPDHFKAALQKEILSHDAPALTVSAHFMQENRKTTVNGQPVTTKGKLIMHLDISPLDGFIAPG